MLAFTRRVGEKFVIGDNIVLTVNRVAGKRVTIGIQAPDSVKIIRGELKRFDDASKNVEQRDVSKAPITYPTPEVEQATFAAGS